MSLQMLVMIYLFDVGVIAEPPIPIWSFDIGNIVAAGDRAAVMDYESIQVIQLGPAPWIACVGSKVQCCLIFNLSSQDADLSALLDLHLNLVIIQNCAAGCTRLTLKIHDPGGC